MRKFAFVLLTIQAICHGDSVAARDLVSLSPSSKWVVDWDENICSLRRQFGEGQDKLLVEFQMDSISPTFELNLAGQKIANNQATYPLLISFGPEGFRPEKRYAISVDTPSGVPTLMVGAVGIARKDLSKPAPQERITFNKAIKGPAIAVERADWDAIAANERAANSIAIEQMNGLHVRLQTGSLGPPMKALRECVSSLWKSWGVDPAISARIATPAQPLASPAQWVTSFDFPNSMLAKGQSALLRFRLIVSTVGTVENCVITKGVGSTEFRELTCALLTKRAKFKPALDNDGRPLKSVFSSSIRWAIPG
ncbi:MAG: energy transducer TonB [Novosphingobium sp.]